MSSRDRALSIIELLASHADGLPLADISAQLALARSATHRLLNDLREMGYVRQEHDRGLYSLTVKLSSLALIHQIGTGITDLVLPILDRLAEESGELAMLCVVEGERLMRTAKARGSRRGLQYNPAEEPEVYLGATSNGFAYLSTMSDDLALQHVAKQGIRPGHGPKAPKSLAEVMKHVADARRLGYSEIHEVFEPGTSAIAAPILHVSNKQTIGTISVAGPSVRMTKARVSELAPDVKKAAEEIGIAALRSPFFSHSTKSDQT
ncbi:MAG: IclR family transcriptional regulator [Pelagibacterium sp.]|uniref:IclR family transcriptional regulator n=1 Tax=Pelagibacterium sp. TaxID=1967288 RepID=UPI0032EF8026